MGLASRELGGLPGGGGEGKAEDTTLTRNAVTLDADRAPQLFDNAAYD